MTEPTHPTGIRLSDDEREAVAVRIREAAAQGRLTLAEADERQRAAYEARVAGDLAPLTADLPAPPPDPAPARRPLSPQARRRLLVHAAVGAAFALLVVLRWVVGPVPFFWPAAPLFWIGVSVAAHYLWSSRRAALRA